MKQLISSYKMGTCYKKKTWILNTFNLLKALPLSRTMSTKFCSQPLILSLLLILLTLILKSNAGDIAIYWGQDVREGTLKATCATGKYAIVNIAFLSTFGSGQTPKLRLAAGHCDPHPNGCQKLSTDISYCKEKGIKVMLSIGGGAATYNLSSNDDAREFAHYLYHNFLTYSDTRPNSRPLGDVGVDGIDFHIGRRLGEPYYGTIATELNMFSQEGKRSILSAAPKCLFPDRLLKGALESGLFDYVWIRFYNNHNCEYASNNTTKFQKSWNQWTSSIQATKFFVGLPASDEAVVSGYIEKDEIVSRVLPMIKASPKYGGVMLWNKYYDDQNGYSSFIKSSV